MQSDDRKRELSTAMQSAAVEASKPSRHETELKVEGKGGKKAKKHYGKQK